MMWYDITASWEVLVVVDTSVTLVTSETGLADASSSRLITVFSRRTVTIAVAS